MEDEDEHSLQSVKDGEQVRHHNRGFIQEEQAKGPSEPQQTEQSKCSQYPRPATEDQGSY